MSRQLLDLDASEDWTLRHGRSVALYIGVKEAGERLLTDEHELKVVKAARSMMAADRIPLCLAGLCCAGFILRHQESNGQQLHMDPVSDVIKCMKQESNDVKQLTANIVTFVAKSSDAPLDMSIIKVLVPMLVMGTKEKNTLVRTNSEGALVALLKLRTDETTLQSCL